MKAPLVGFGKSNLVHFGLENLTSVGNNFTNFASIPVVVVTVAVVVVACSSSIPLDVVSVTHVMSLHLFLWVVQHYYSCYEVDNLSCRQQMDVTSCISATIAIADP